MASQSTITRLNNYIGFKTYYLLRSHGFPVTDDAGILSVEEALKKLGWQVELDDNSRTLNVNANIWLDNLEDGFSYEASISYDSILNGNGNYQRGSLTSIDQSVMNFFNNIQSRIPSGLSRSLFSIAIDRAHKSVSDAVNICLQTQIAERRDALLLNRLLQPSTTEYTSDLLDNVLSRYNLDYYERALEIDEDRKDNFPENPRKLLYNKWECFDDVNFPRASEFESFFWGAYLCDLSRLKGYDTRIKPVAKLEDFVREREAVILNARHMNWGIEVTEESN